MIDIKSVATEKMIYVNDREIPIIEDSLTAAEMLKQDFHLPSTCCILSLMAMGAILKEKESHLRTVNG